MARAVPESFLGCRAPSHSLSHFRAIWGVHQRGRFSPLGQRAIIPPESQSLVESTLPGGAKTGTGRGSCAAARLRRGDTGGSARSSQKAKDRCDGDVGISVGAPVAPGSLGMMTERLFSEESAAVKRRLFTLALLLSTWIPMACLIAAGFYETPSRGPQATQTTLVFINGLHVAATLCLYVDSQFLRLIKQNQARYVYFPLAVSIGSGVIFALGSLVMQAYWLLIYWAWQAYHYGRQNIGVYSFASIAQGRRVGRAERRALELAIGCGICGTFKILGMGVAPSYLHDVFDGLYRLGAVVFVGVLGLSAYVYIANRKHLSLTQTAFFCTLILFFGPSSCRPM